MTELFFVAFQSSKDFLDVLSDWFRYLKIFFTQEKVNVSYLLFCSGT